MGAASFQQSSYLHEASLSRRAVSLALAIAANILLLVMLFTLAPAPSVKKPEPEQKVLSFALTPAPKPAADRARAIAKAEQTPSSTAPRRPTTPTPPKVETTPPPLNMIILSKEAFAAADIAKLPNRSEDRPAGAASASDSASANADDAAGQGTGPNGERLYNAELVRAPTNAELAAYMPKKPPSKGWGEVACRMTASLQLEDCVELGQSPRGSGLSRMLRQSAWQFRIRPPRIGGRVIPGTWVRIHLDFTLTVEP